MYCPLCKSSDATNLFELNCGNFNSSALYEIAKPYACNTCGHIFNGLSSDEFSNLQKYYDEEYAPTNMGANDGMGLRPGCESKNASARYAKLYDFISPYIEKDSSVLDVGCATGGFLNYLHMQGFKKLAGIDSTPKYIQCALEKSDYEVKLGMAESIPYEDGRFDLLIMDQVMEHLADPGIAFDEAKRVLVNGGLFCIGVPDAARYDQIYFFDFFWFLIREHIQHYDLEHLELLAGMYGFELVSVKKSETPMMSEKMILPSLDVIFRLTGEKHVKEKSFNLVGQIKTYVGHERARLDRKKEVIEAWAKLRMPIYVWGIGREFLYLYSSANLKQCNILELVDASPYKQNHCMLGGRKIVAPSLLRNAPADSALLITAMAHSGAVRAELDRLNYRGRILDLSIKSE